MSETKQISAKSIARLAYGYELMFVQMCHIAGTSGGSTSWFTAKGQEVTARVDPLWKLSEESNSHKPGDCLSQHEPFAAWAYDVERKAAALEHWRQEVGKLHSQIQKLHEALAPFAAVAAMDIGEDETDADLFQVMQNHNHAPKLKVGDFRRALASFPKAEGSLT